MAATAKKVSRKIRKLRSEGKPQRQAVAIALSMQRPGSKKKMTRSKRK